MSQIARNLTDLEDGILTGKRYLIHDRDPLFTAEFLRADATINSHWSDRIVPGWQSRMSFEGKTADLLRGG